MKKKLVRIVSLVLCLVAICSLCASAYAAGNSYPSLSETNYCEFIAPRRITVYRDKGCNTPGTCSPAASYNAFISAGDKCYMYKIASTYIKVNYPIDGGGRKTGYIKRSAFAEYEFLSSPLYVFKSVGSVKTYDRENSKQQYGSIYKKDTVYYCGIEYDGLMMPPDRVPVIYPARSGNRGYKYAWISDSDFRRIMG